MKNIMKNKNCLFNNKKADERLLSIYLFMIYIIVSIGIVSGVLFVFGSIDVREAEAGVLNDKVVDCLVEQGILDKNILVEGFNLLDYCNFNFNDEKTGEEQYGVRIEVLDFYSEEKLKEAIFGRDDFLKFCNEKGQRIPKCNEKKVYVIGFEENEVIADAIADPDDVSANVESSDLQNKYLLKVTSAVGKTAQNT